MRFPLPAVAVCLLLAPAAGSLTMAAQSGARSIAPGAPGASAPAKQPAPPAPVASADNDAAARHAKRTACLKDARAKKLVGAQRTAYVKQCVGGN